VAIITTFEYAPFDEADPDDYRPSSKVALLVDPGPERDARVDDITLVAEVIAPGDRIPRHTHPISEVIVVDEGMPEVWLDDDRREVGPGAVIFIPAGSVHGIRNESALAVRLHAVFPSQQIGIHYLERNPAPGTEGQPPQPAFTIDARALASTENVGK